MKQLKAKLETCEEKLKGLESDQQRLHKQAYQQKLCELEDRATKLKIGRSDYKRRFAKRTTDRDELLVKVKELKELKAQTYVEMANMGKLFEELKAKAEGARKEAEDAITSFQNSRESSRPWLEMLR